MKQAEILIEALPYIKQFRKQRMVIKLGGSILEDTTLTQSLLKSIVLLMYVGVQVVVVHGGGNHVSSLLKRLGKESQFIEGLRVTDAETLEVVQMVLAGWINKNLTGLIEKEGGSAVGLSGKDAALVIAAPLEHRSAQYGLVGTVEKINSQILETLLSDGFIPVISPIASDGSGGTLNVNADTVAGALAVALRAQKLIFITDVKGVYQNVNDETSLIANARVEQIASWIKNKTVIGGMIPKVEMAERLLQEKSLEAIHLISGKIPHALLIELFTQRGIGTKIA